MPKSLVITTEKEDGVEALLRVVGVLRRKRYEIVNVRFSDEVGRPTSLEITIGDNSTYASETAVMHVRKCYGISGIEEVM